MFSVLAKTTAAVALVAAALLAGATADDADDFGWQSVQASGATTDDFGWQ